MEWGGSLHPSWSFLEEVRGLSETGGPTCSSPSDSVGWATSSSFPTWSAHLPPLYCPREAALLMHDLIHADDVPRGTVQGDGVRHAQGAGMDAPAHCQVRRRPGPGRIFYPQAVKDAPGTALNSDAAYADIPVRSRIGSPPLTPDRRPRGGGALSRRLLVESV